MRTALIACLALSPLPAFADGWALMGIPCENGPAIVIESQRIERLDFSCDIEAVAETASEIVYTAHCLTDAPSNKTYTISIRHLGENTAEIDWLGIDRAVYQRCVRADSHQ